MANAARSTDLNTPLLEEQVDSGLRELMAEYQPPYTPGGHPVDLIEDRYSIHTGKPIPSLRHEFAEAFEASDTKADDRSLYAMVCRPDMPYRNAILPGTVNLNNPHIQLPVSHGVARCSHVGESRFVLIFERPQGTPLSQLIENQTRLHETKVITAILAPACNALLQMRDRKFHHGNLRPETIFMGNPTMLGECFSAPSSTLSHFIYESPERGMADPMGRGEADEKSDLYSLAMIAFEALYGLGKLKELSRDEFYLRCMRQGTYQTITNSRDMPALIQDFFRGVLTDNINDRWTLDQLAQFIDGKRFNPITPTPPKDAARPFMFNEEAIFGRRLFAYIMHRHWKEFTKDIRSMYIDRWCDTSLHRPEVAESVERALRLGGDRMATERQVSDMMTRIMLALDPYGPLRSRSLSLRPEGIPLMLAVLQGSNEAELQQLLGHIDSEVSAMWAEQSSANKTPLLLQVIWRLQRVKQYLKNKALGFGVERALYEMNPSLPCQSPLLKQYHISTVEEALLTLDALSKTRTAEHSLADRHLAGFIAARTELAKPIRLSELTSILGLQNNPELLMLRLLAKAQQKYSHLKLVGLSTWAAMHVEEMMGEIHNRAIRKHHKLKLKRRASTGKIYDVLATVLNREVGDKDTDGFSHAMARYDINHRKIQMLQNPLIVHLKSRKMGGKMAMTLSYIALTLMVCHLTLKVLV